MMQGASFVQKSSSSSLWNVASFSTIMTNFAEDTISVHYQGKHKPSIQEWQKGEGCAYNTQSNSQITKDTSNPTNVWRNCNSLKQNTVIKIGSTSKRCQSLKCIPCCYKHCCTIVVRQETQGTLWSSWHLMLLQCNTVVSHVLPAHECHVLQGYKTHISAHCRGW